jgi:hypothetical protein
MSLVMAGGRDERSAVRVLTIRTAMAGRPVGRVFERRDGSWGAVDLPGRRVGRRRYASRRDASWAVLHAAEAASISGRVT